MSLFKAPVSVWNTTNWNELIYIIAIIIIIIIIFQQSVFHRNRSLLGIHIPGASKCMDCSHLNLEHEIYWSST